VSLNDGLLESWALSLHSKSPRTVVLYLSEVRRYAQWLAEADRPAGTPGDLLEVSRQDAEAYIASMRSAGLQPATIRSRWIALRSLYGWCVEEDELDESPLARVHVSKADPPPIDVLSADDFAKLLKACSGRAFNDRRDAALISFLWATGLRVSEACSLRVDEVDLVQRVALVKHGKGDRHRLCRFDPQTAALIDRYKRVRGRHKLTALPALWLGYRGPLTRKGVTPMLTRRSAAAGIGHVNPHRFRHSWADRWLANGGSEGDLQKLGGWENAEVMRRYGSARAVDRALAAYDGVMGG
jgi:site-specific recombinase XerD